MSYDAFSQFYDAMMGDRSELISQVSGLLKQYAPNAKTLLELGCGTGVLLQALDNQYACTGVDLSKGMLRQAVSRKLSARLVHGNIGTFELKEKYDVILCLFDTINHLNSTSQWRATFRQVKKHLNPNGVFIFDVNTPRKLSKYANEIPYAFIGKDRRTIVQVIQNSPQRFTFHVESFEKLSPGRFQQTKVLIPELIIPVDEIKRMLNKYFSTVHCRGHRKE